MENRKEGDTKGEKAPEPQERQKRKTQEGCSASGGTAGVRASQGKVCIRAADMPAKMQMWAFRCAQEVLAGMPKLESKRLAQTLKKEFDSRCGPAWHCIVGTSFGSYVTHSLEVFCTSPSIRSTFSSSRLPLSV
ncbi:unnamed protein product [Spirodela intermedia]|uniref:Dynein light chain n=1 Tax=Spirodela intermedia TaxID=51605 RepID=A0A7I8INT3_SPIIN|nr:unnamed protein product [Spirodela intermedia]CAA6658647.1 unnamed protein product [Spirodela intermedia]